MVLPFQEHIYPIWPLATLLHTSETDNKEFTYSVLISLENAENHQENNVFEMAKRTLRMWAFDNFSEVANGKYFHCH